MSLRESKRDGFHLNLDHSRHSTKSFDDETTISSSPSSKSEKFSDFLANLENDETTTLDLDLMESNKRSRKNLQNKLSKLGFPLLASVMILCVANNAYRSVSHLLSPKSKSTPEDVLNNAILADEDYTQPRRALSINLGGGDCKWTNSREADQSKPLWTSLIVSYPGSGKRTTFLQLEGLTELVSGDDHILRFEPPETKKAFMKTSYPQHHGTWGWEDRSHQALLIVRNPRWALVNFHATLYEIDFSTSWIESYLRQHYVYTKRPPLEDWVVFRDLRFDDEIKLWGWLIDFWMEGGLLRNFKTNELVDEETFNMVLQPHIYTEAELLAVEISEDAYYDSHCLNDIESGCEPTAVASIERIMANETGPAEMAKLAATIEGKPGITIIEEEARECVWEEMMWHHKNHLPHFPNRDKVGPDEEEFLFTKPQMEKIIEEIKRVRDKYNSTEWEDNENAQQLVGFFEEYIVDNEAELATL